MKLKYYILIDFTRMLLKICYFYVSLYFKEEKTFQRFLAFGIIFMASCTCYMLGAKMCIVFYLECLKVQWTEI